MKDIQKNYFDRLIVILRARKRIFDSRRLNYLIAMNKLHLATLIGDKDAK